MSLRADAHVDVYSVVARSTVCTRLAETVVDICTRPNTAVVITTSTHLTVKPFHMNLDVISAYPVAGELICYW